jgi:hypothetical protein
MFEELQATLSDLQRRVAALEGGVAAGKSLRIVNELQGDQLAYNFQTAAAKLGISYMTLNREMRRGRLHPLEGMKLIARGELERWVRERSPVVQPGKRQRINGAQPALA